MDDLIGSVEERLCPRAGLGRDRLRQEAHGSLSEPQPQQAFGDARGHLRRGGLGERDRDDAAEHLPRDRGGPRNVAVFGESPRRPFPARTDAPGDDARDQHRRLPGAGARLDDLGSVELELCPPAGQGVARHVVRATHPSSPGFPARRAPGPGAPTSRGRRALPGHRPGLAEPTSRGGGGGPSCPCWRHASWTAHQPQAAGAAPSGPTSRGTKPPDARARRESRRRLGTGLAKGGLASVRPDVGRRRDAGLPEQVAGGCALAATQQVDRGLEPGPVRRALEQLLLTPLHLHDGADGCPGLVVGQHRPVGTLVDPVRAERHGVAFVIGVDDGAAVQLGTQHGLERTGRPVRLPDAREERAGALGQHPRQTGQHDSLFFQDLAGRAGERVVAGFRGRPCDTHRNRRRPGGIEGDAMCTAGIDDDPLEEAVHEVAEQERGQIGECRRCVGQRLEPQGALEEHLPSAPRQAFERRDRDVARDHARPHEPHVRTQVAGVAAPIEFGRHRDASVRPGTGRERRQREIAAALAEGRFEQASRHASIALEPCEGGGLVGRQRPIARAEPLGREPDVRAPGGEAKPFGERRRRLLLAVVGDGEPTHRHPRTRGTELGEEVALLVVAPPLDRDVGQDAPFDAASHRVRQERVLGHGPWEEIAIHTDDEQVLEGARPRLGRREHRDATAGPSERIRADAFESALEQHMELGEIEFEAFTDIGAQRDEGLADRGGGLRAVVPSEVVDRQRFEPGEMGAEGRGPGPALEDLEQRTHTSHRRLEGRGREFPPRCHPTGPAPVCLALPLALVGRLQGREAFPDRERQGVLAAQHRGNGEPRGEREAGAAQ